MITGNITQLGMFMSVNGGVGYSLGAAADLSGMSKTTPTSLTTPAGETDLWGLTWNPSLLDWDNVWLKITVTGGAANRYFYFDYFQLKVFYTGAVTIIPKSLTINGTLTLNGQLTIK